MTGIQMPEMVSTVIWCLTQHGLVVNSERICSEGLLTLATTDSPTGILNRRAGQAAFDDAVYWTCQDAGRGGWPVFQPG